MRSLVFIATLAIGGAGCQPEPSATVSPSSDTSAMVPETTTSNSSAVQSTEPKGSHRITQPDPKEANLETVLNPSESARDWTAIVVHHTATERGSVESIHQTHLARKWLGIGYHFVIGNGQGMDDGLIEETFRWRGQMHGAHAGRNEYNQHGIGIALIGNFENTPPTPAQIESLTELVTRLARTYQIPPDRIFGHGELKTTACPGRLFPLAELRLACQTEPRTADRPAYAFEGSAQ